MKTQIAIIGGGAAGLMAAIKSSKENNQVTIYEKMNRVGKKILATGNGRCNFTNTNMSIDFYHGHNVQKIKDIFDFCDLQTTLNFFEDIGIYPYMDISGKVYPYSLQASSVLDDLRNEAMRLNVIEMVECEVTHLRKNKGRFDIVTKDKVYSADKVIVATGGKACPQMGSDGSGYALAKELGHRLSEPFPALVQLKLNANFLKRISGVKFDGCVACECDGEVIREESGEILFTDYGISGPPILQISRKALEKYNAGNEVTIVIDMFPEYSKSMLYDIISNRFIKLKHKTLEESFIGLLNKKIIPVVLSEAGFEYKNEKCTKLNKKDIYKIINILKEWKIQVSGHNGWNQAQTTAGGILLDDIDLKTMESKKVKNLFFAGEILDVDGDCGGYNLQWAWSSGYTAGYYASL